LRREGKNEGCFEGGVGMNVPVMTDMIQEVEGNLEVPEIRVWCHPPKIGESGDDYYKRFDSFRKALDFIERTKEAEDVPLIAFRGYEFNLWGIKEENNEQQ